MICVLQPLRYDTVTFRGDVSQGRCLLSQTFTLSTDQKLLSALNLGKKRAYGSLTLLSTQLDEKPRGETFHV